MCVSWHAGVLFGCLCTGYSLAIAMFCENGHLYARGCIIHLDEIGQTLVVCQVIV